MRVALIEKKSVADGTLAFSFTKPEGFSYKAGQSMDLTLIDVPVTDVEGNTRAYSIASAPHEEHLMIATRMRDTAFKNTLKELPAGTELIMDGPFGSFFLHENVKRPAIFIAGGIGVTPFRSMALDASARQLPHEITLLYSNREAKDAAFLEELTNLQQQNAHFKLVPIFTKTDGHLDEVKIKAHVELDSLPIFYLAGPSKMVMPMWNMLKGMGISGDDIRFEEFAGY